MFDHERLEAYQRSRHLNRLVHRLARKIPRGHGDLIDQLRRASTSISLNLAEGSGEFAPKEKARFYRMARRSGAETAAILDLLVDIEVIGEADVTEVRNLLRRIVGMLVNLIRNLEQSGKGKGRGTGRGQGHGQV